MYTVTAKIVHSFILFKIFVLTIGFIVGTTLACMKLKSALITDIKYIYIHTHSCIYYFSLYFGLLGLCPDGLAFYPAYARFKSATEIPLQGGIFIT